jgi:hypothetical protein
MIDVVKAFSYVRDYGPLAATCNNRSCDGNGLMSIPMRAKAIAEPAERRLKYWLQNGEARSLHNPVPGARYTQIANTTV